MFPLVFGPRHTGMSTQSHGHVQQPTSQGHPNWIPWAPPALGESSNFSLTTPPPPTPRKWALQGSAIYSHHQTQCWTCHSQGSMGELVRGELYLRVSAVCPYLSLKLSSYICNCLLDNVKKIHTAGPATSMDKRAHINWEPKEEQRKKKNTLCTLR